MNYKKPEPHEVIGSVGALLGIGGFFLGLFYKENISGWLCLIYPISLLIAMASIGLGENGVKGSIGYGIWFLSFIGSTILIASILTRTSAIPVCIIVIVALSISGFMASYIVAKIFRKQ